jgi:hypothetical protein
VIYFSQLMGRSLMVSLARIMRHEDDVRAALEEVGVTLLGVMRQKQVSQGMPKTARALVFIPIVSDEKRREAEATLKKLKEEKPEVPRFHIRMKPRPQEYAPSDC